MKIYLALLFSFALRAEITTLQVDNRKAAIVYLPSDYSKRVDWPLVISIHGFLSNPAFQEKIFPAKDLVSKMGFVLITPFGNRNFLGIRFWNIPGKCCDLFKQNPDDINYLKKLIIKAQEKYSINPKKVLLVGHSNGGFLAYKLACEASDLITGIVSISGVNFYDENTCKPSKPVSIIHLHGENDRVVKYNGNPRKKYPSALDSILPWVNLNNCKTKIETGDSTKILSFNDCNDESFVELWSFKKRNHNKSLGKDLTEKILKYFL